MKTYFGFVLYYAFYVKLLKFPIFSYFLVASEAKELKFIYSEKAKKFCVVSILLLTGTT